jgi:electron transfer flavoprotein alpha subunit
MAKIILAVLEQREGKLKRNAFEVISTAKMLSNYLDLSPIAICIGNNVEGLGEAAASYGITKVVQFKSPELENYSPSAYTDIIEAYAKETDAECLLYSNTSLGRDLAPRTAIRLNAGCLMDCINLHNTNGEVIALRPVYAGKAIVEGKINSRVKVFTIRPNVFKAVIVEDKVQVDTEVREIKNPNLKTKVTAVKKSEGKLDVAEADIIVSGGRGLKGPENFNLIEELAEVLGGAVGASRAVVDAGWRNHGEQVGQTGKTVSPKLYIACGISGAIQHLAGMSSSRYIVAINKDKDAPIFNIADYGIAGDLFEIIPALTKEIRKIK